MVKHILVPLDGSPVAESALPHAIALANAVDADITLLRALDGSMRHNFSSAAVESRLRRAEARAYLEERAESVGQQGIQVRTEIREGAAAEEIATFAREAEVDLIAMCTHGAGGLDGFQMGSVALKVVADGAASIFLSRAGQPVDGPVEYGLVMVPVDGSPQSDWALCLAASIARAQGGELLIVQAVPVPDMPRRLPLERSERRIQRAFVHANRKAARRNLAESKGRLETDNLKVHTRMAMTSHVSETLHRIAKVEGAGLIVASAHGTSGASRSAYGSVATHLIGCGETPILIFQDAPRGARSTAVPPHDEVRVGDLDRTAQEHSAQLSGNGAR